MAGGCQPLGRVLGQAAPDLAGGSVHPAGRDFRQVAEVGPETSRTEGARQCDSIVEGCANRCVSTGGFVGEAPCQEELPTAGGVGGMPAASHPRERQEAQQQEMAERDDEFLDQGTRLLKRNAAAKVRLGVLQKSRDARQAVGSQPDVGIEEHKKRMAGHLCQERAGVLLATPARGERLSSQETDTAVSLRDG